MQTDYPKTPRPTTYRGVKMRSRLEAGYAQWLDKAGFDWTYEPQAFGGSRGQYLPDFRLEGVMIVRDDREPAPKVAYVEVKHLGWLPPEIADEDDEEDPWRKWMQRMDGLILRMSVVLESEPNAVLLLERPGLTSEICISPYGKWDWVDSPMVWAYQQSNSSRPDVWLIDDPELFEPPWHGEWWKR